MYLRVLGLVELRIDGRTLVARRPQQAAVLAALAVDANRPLRTEALIARIWGEQPPERARRTLHTHISGLRRLLEQGGGERTTAQLLRRPGCYLLEVDADCVDLHRFQRLTDTAADRTGDERVMLLRAAMRLWRGDALAGVPGDWAQRVREAYRQHYLGTAVNWAQAEVMAGNADTVIGPLTLLAGEYPLTESLAGALMRALHAAGRGADALDQYARTRRRLVDELGVEPGPDLRAVNAAILRGEPLPARPGAPDAPILSSVP